MHSRRDVLQGSMGLAGVVAISSATSVRAAPPPSLREQLGKDMETYASFGSKLSGTPGDLAAAKWIGGRLSDAGFTVNKVDFPVPMFDARLAELRVGDKRIAIMPQPIVVPTPADGITAKPLLIRDRFDAKGAAGRIASLQFICCCFCRC